jgi:DNA-binding transcriptional LysR family regulator
VDKLRAMHTFVAIADAGSLTAASKSLGCSLPAVVRSLAALEAELGARLFNRTTRRIALTEAGRRYLERCREVQALVADAEAELGAEQKEAAGQLSVTAPVLFGERHLTGGITAFVRRHPLVQVQVLLVDRIVNLVEEGVDVGVRIGDLPDSSLVARAVGEMRRLTVAAPGYLVRHGTPRHPKELTGHNCVRYWRAGAPSWTFSVDGKPLPVPVRGNFSINQSAAAAEACAAGLGIGTFFAYQVAPLVATGRLRVILAPFETPPRPIHIVYPAARLLPARTRLFIDAMARHVQAAAPSWQPPSPGARTPRTTQGNQ